MPKHTHISRHKPAHRRPMVPLSQTYMMLRYLRDQIIPSEFAERPEEEVILVADSEVANERTGFRFSFI